ncbi:hypothetical protein CC80DRAFT_552800 [Byssothecium circinans]|uniref:Uncharacterized protein n=1 Tax=Byssothecium circinans TaxID=147558 RepID=A0A6A5TIS0_9PLEO|nr:hypothetical protein CC80DRAFT_552800 [Byssothecium circinans]
MFSSKNKNPGVRNAGKSGKESKSKKGGKYVIPAPPPLPTIPASIHGESSSKKNKSKSKPIPPPPGYPQMPGALPMPAQDPKSQRKEEEKREKERRKADEERRKDLEKDQRKEQEARIKKTEKDAKGQQKESEKEAKHLQKERDREAKHHQKEKQKMEERKFRDEKKPKDEKQSKLTSFLQPKISEPLAPQHLYPEQYPGHGVNLQIPVNPTFPPQRIKDEDVLLANGAPLFGFPKSHPQEKPLSLQPPRPMANIMANTNPSMNLLPQARTTDTENHNGIMNNTGTSAWGLTGTNAPPTTRDINSQQKPINAGSTQSQHVNQGSFSPQMINPVIGPPPGYPQRPNPSILGPPTGDPLRPNSSMSGLPPGYSQMPNPSMPGRPPGYPQQQLPAPVNSFQNLQQPDVKQTHIQNAQGPETKRNPTQMSGSPSGLLQLSSSPRPPPLPASGSLQSRRPEEWPSGQEVKSPQQKPIPSQVTPPVQGNTGHQSELGKFNNFQQATPTVSSPPPILPDPAVSHPTNFPPAISTPAVSRLGNNQTVSPESVRTI